MGTRYVGRGFLARHQSLTHVGQRQQLLCPIHPEAPIVVFP